jgi:hypothetical protein
LSGLLTMMTMILPTSMVFPSMMLPSRVMQCQRLRPLVDHSPIQPKEHCALPDLFVLTLIPQPHSNTWTPHLLPMQVKLRHRIIWLWVWISFILTVRIRSLSTTTCIFRRWLRNASWVDERIR